MNPEEITDPVLLRKELSRLQRKIERAREILGLLKTCLNAIPFDNIQKMIENTDRILDYQRQNTPVQNPEN